MGPLKLGMLSGALATALCISSAAAEADVQSARNTEILEINGAKVTMADLEAKRAAALFSARTNYYDAERKVMEELIDEYLLEQQAKKEGLSVEGLIDRHVNSAVSKDPSEEALRVYYEGVDTTEPYEAVRDKIIETLRQRRQLKAKNGYIKSLRSQASIVVRLAPPRAPISMGNTPARGAANASVTLLEYADYECPYCQQIQPVIEKLEEEYKGKIAFAYKDFPLSMHAFAQKAAEASHCAEAQGKYWEYHDILSTTKQLDPSALKNHARALKLDVSAFDKCLDTGEKGDGVKATLAEAMNLGLQGTPSFFINGRAVSGAPSYERLRAVIAEELSALSNQAGAQTPPARANER